MSQPYIFEHKTEFKLPYPFYPGETNTTLPTFSPLPDSNSLSFYFEVSHQDILHPTSSDISLFKLKLVKLPFDGISPSLKARVEVKMYYPDGNLFKFYELYNSINVKLISCLKFQSVVNLLESMKKIGAFAPGHSFKAKSDRSWVIKCKMIFTDQIPIINPKGNLERLPAFCQNLKTFYESNVLSDFTFQVGDQTLNAHKNILAAHSPVFLKMMTGDFLECKTSSVDIPDASPKVFDVFLKFLYSSEIGDKSWPTLKELCYLADKYDIGILKDECCEVIVPMLSISLICEILEVAYNFNIPNLKTTARNFAVINIKMLTLREDWKNLVNTNPIIGYEVAAHFIPSPAK